MRSFLNVLTVSFTAALAFGCGAESGPVTTDLTAADDLRALQALDHDLVPGASGAEVRAVHAYLTRYGYFPNDELAQVYPAWRPFAEAPADRSVYDANTRTAILALQQNYGLPTTGIVDESTRASMLMPRCSTPEIQDADEKNKWELQGTSWGTNSLTWKVINSDDGLTVDQVRAAAAASFAQWASVTAFTFTEIFSGTADIEIQFTANPPPPGGLAVTFYPAFGGDVYFNTSTNWSVTDPAPGSHHDLQSVMIHELGHAIGINHSSYDINITDVDRAVMFPGINVQSVRRNLKPDDAVAGHAKNIGWTMFDTSTLDLDVDDGPGYHYVYALGGATLAGGREIWVLTNKSAWSVIGGSMGAVRVASNGGTNTWIVQDDGDTYQRNGSDWVFRPGCSTDIAVGPDNSVWRIGCTATSGGFRIYKRSGSSWVQANSGAVRISVGRRGPGGTIVPWIVQDDGDVFRRSSNSATSGSWNTLPGDPVDAVDITASDSGFTWIIGTNSVFGGNNIEVWNEQPALAGFNPSPQALNQWLEVWGPAYHISSDSFGRPYISNFFEEAYWTF